MQNRNSSVTTKVNEQTQQLTSCIRLSPYKKWDPLSQEHVKYNKYPNYCSVCNMDAIQKTVNSVRNGGAVPSTPKESVHFEPYSIRNTRSPPLANYVCSSHHHNITKDELANKTETFSPNKKHSNKDSNFYTRQYGVGVNNYNVHSPEKSPPSKQTGYLSSQRKSLSFLKSGSASPELNYVDPRLSPTRKGLEHTFKESANHSTFRKMIDKSPNKNTHQRATTSPVVKCGNSSCNGSKPLKETHITNTHSNGFIENPYRDEAAHVRGQVREASGMKKLREESKKNDNRNTPSPVEKKFKEYHSPKSPKTFNSSPVRVDVIEINSSDQKHSPVIIASNGEVRKHSTTKKLFNEQRNALKIENSCKTELYKKPSKCLSNNSTSNGASNSTSNGTSNSNSTSMCTSNITSNGTSTSNSTNNGLKPARTVRRHRSNQARNSGTESELSDSECSGPDEADTEEKQVNYDTVLSELASIKKDLYKAYNPSLHELHPKEALESGDNNVSSNKPSVLRPSLFPHVPPYLKFYPHDQCGPKMPSSIQKHLRWRLSNITPVIVRKTLLNSGFRLVRVDSKPETEWIGTWGKHMKSPLFKQLKENQKMNHFPGTFQLGRKDRLWRNTQKLQIKFGFREFDYVPKTYILPQDIRQLRHVWDKGEGLVQWILKPPASARGAGIRVVNQWNQVPKKKPLVVQRYIENPYLINGSKFDLRLYVLITSFDPMRIYLYPDGLARFASVKYSSDCSTLDNRYMHLTNYSINKLSRDYTANEDAGACQGHKWTIQSLWDYLEKTGINTKQLWESLKDLVIKTIISGESGITQLLRGNVNSRYNCYELFGVDVLLDENLKPWLLEVNISPSLHSTSPLDLFVKGPLVQTLLNMAQYHIPNDSLTPQQRQHVIKTLGLAETEALKSSLSPTSRKNSSKSEHHNNGAGDACDVPLCYDPRIYTVELTQRERLKQHQMVSFTHRADYLEDILLNLTPDDVRHLIIAEDELQAAGQFEKIFPTKTSHHYLPLMEIRYYDRLFDAWENKYASKRNLGIGLLQAYCGKKYHLIVPPPPKIIKEDQTSETKVEEENGVKVTTTPDKNVSGDAAVQDPSTPNPSTEGTTVIEGPSPSRKPSHVVRRRFNRIGLLTIKHYPRTKYISNIAYPRLINRRMQRFRKSSKSKSSEQTS